MRSRIFSQADRRAFARACELMGGHDEEKLAGRLAENLVDGQGQVFDRSVLEEAGRRELSWFSGGGKWLVSRRGSSLFDRQGKDALISLQTVLFYPGLKELDLTQRAGLHRLARALCDIDPSDLEHRLAPLPASWRECLQAAIRQLAGQPESAESAPNLRAELQLKGRTPA